MVRTRVNSLHFMTSLQCIEVDRNAPLGAIFVLNVQVVHIGGGGGGGGAGVLP